MGTVYKVWDLKRNVNLAMKVLHADFEDDTAVHEQFRREANALQRLAHPNIVPFYGFYVSAGVAFLLEHFIDGPSLKQILRIRHKKPLPLNQSLAYLQALSSGLGYSHSNGVVHCDVKPGNVMVDQGGSIYLTDFGVARHADSTRTLLGVAGTASYMAPEQCRGEAVSAATDIYGLAVVLFEMLTGERPYKGISVESSTSGSTGSERIRYEHLHQPVPDPRAVNPHLPDILTSVMKRALAKNPDDRFQTTRAFSEAVSHALGTEPARIPGRVKVPSRLARGRSQQSEISALGGEGQGRVVRERQFTNLPLAQTFRKRTVFLVPLGAVILVGLVILVGGGSTEAVPTASVPVTGDETLVPSSPTEALTPTPERKAPTPIPTVTYTPIPGSQWEPIANCPPSRLRIGNWTRVTKYPSDPNRIRAAPSVEGKYLGQVWPGGVIQILGGPECVDGYLWWYVTTEDGDLEGWTAEGYRGRSFLEPGSKSPP